MRLAIVDSCFSLKYQRMRGLAARWLNWELNRHGIEETTIECADIILVTCVDPRQNTFIKNLRKCYEKKKIIVGGAAATSPFIFGLYADMVCVGDGRIMIDTLINHGMEAATYLPNAWCNDQSRAIEIDQSFPWDCPPIKGQDKAVRLWVGRGCKKRCFFCQTGWSLKYQENPDSRTLIRQAKALVCQGQQISYLSNDPGQHSFSQQLPPIRHGSYSFDYLRRYGLPTSMQVRIGVEGVSERLRKRVGKPIMAEELVDCTSWLHANGKSVRWFLIAGLPGEEKEDWDEFRDTVQIWKSQTPKGVLGLSFTAFVPMPAAPMAILPLEDSYWERWLKFENWFFNGKGWSNKIQIMAPAQPKNRMQNAMASMGLNEKQLRSGGSWGPNDRVAYPHKMVRNQIGEKLMRAS